MISDFAQDATKLEDSAIFGSSHVRRLEGISSGASEHGQVSDAVPIPQLSTFVTPASLDLGADGDLLSKKDSDVFSNRF